VLNLRAVAGEYDFQERHLEIPKLPVLLSNQQRAGYKVYLDPAEYGSDALVLINLSYDGDPEIAKWLGNRDFRRALALGLDRDQFNEVFWLGVGTPGSPVVTESHPYNPGPEWRKKWSVYDPKQANEMLDKVGLDKKDPEGFRLRTDGKGRLRIQIAARVAMFMDFVGMIEMAKEQWKKIGIDVEVAGLERTLYETRMRGNELQAVMTMNTGSEVLWSYPQNILPVSPESPNGPMYSRWYNSGGKQGKEPTDPQVLKALDLFRSAGGLKEAERIRAAQEIWKIVIDEQWGIGIVGQGPAFMGVRVAKANMGNIPGRLSLIRDARIPGGSHPATYFFKS
jgi:peptide/nickel transport system substrate-binding protein